MGIDEPPNGTRHDSSSAWCYLAKSQVYLPDYWTYSVNPPLARTSPQMHGLVLAEEL